MSVKLPTDLRGDNDVYSSPSVLCSPDGQTIAVFGNRNKVGLSLYVMKTDGSELQLVKSLTIHKLRPSFQDDVNGSNRKPQVAVSGWLTIRSTWSGVAHARARLLRQSAV